MNLDGRLHKAIQNSSKGNDGINIGIIGEFGTGKSTYIKKELANLAQDEGENYQKKYKIINISLMSSTFKKQEVVKNYNNSEYDKGLTIRLDSKETKSNNPSTLDRQIEIEILNKVISRIKFSLIDKDVDPKLYRLSLSKENINKLVITSLSFSVSLLILYLLVLFTENVYIIETIPILKSTGEIILKTSVLFFAVILFIKGVTLFFENNSLNIKKLNFQIANIELALNDDDSISNLSIYEEYFLYLIEKYQQQNKEKEKIVFIFEDIDRISESFLLDYLREVNVFLNNQTSENTRIIFIYAIRSRLFEKLSEKKEETRYLIKQQKFFSDTIIVKPFGDGYKKEIYNDIQLLYREGKLNQYSENCFFNTIENKYSDKLNMIKSAYQKILEQLKDCNLEYDLDFRVYTKMVTIIYLETNKYSEFLIDHQSDLKENFESIVFACIFRFNVKNAYEFIDFYEYFKNNDPRTNTGYIKKEESKRLTEMIFYRISSKYPNRENELKRISSVRERKLCEKFIELDYSREVAYVNNILFSEIIGIDVHQRYFNNIGEKFNAFYKYPLNLKEVTKILQISRYYEKILINKPNKYLMLNNYTELINFVSDKQKLEKQWITTCIENNQIRDIIEAFLKKIDDTQKLISDRYTDSEFLDSILNIDYVIKQINIAIEDSTTNSSICKLLVTIYKHYNFESVIPDRITDCILDNRRNISTNIITDKFMDDLKESKVKKLVSEYNKLGMKGRRKAYKKTLIELNKLEQNFLNKDLVVGILRDDIENDYDNLEIEKREKRQLSTKIEKIVANSL